jgi:integrase
MNEVDRYLASRTKRISPNYLRDTAAVLHAWQRSVSNVESVSRDAMQLWIDELTVKPSTVAAYVFTVRKFFDWCIAQGLRADNPANNIVVPRCRKPFRKTFVSAQIVAKLIGDCHDKELQYCLYAGFHAGLRFSEVVASRPAWFNLSQQTLSVLRSEDYDTKDHTDRDIPLTDRFMEFLDDYGFPEPFMIAPHKLSAVKHRYRFDFSNRFENYVRAQGVKMTFHDCRRTFCSLHVQAGTNVYKVAKWIGDDVEVVQRHYGHLEKSDPEINRAFDS